MRVREVLDQMSAYKFDKARFFAECEAVYKTYPTDVYAMEDILNRRLAAQPDASSMRKKVWVYEVAAAHAAVHIFPASPFYAELDTGRERNSITTSFPPQPGLHCWLMKQYPAFTESFLSWREHYEAHGVLNGCMFMDASHHYANCETVVEKGFAGIQAETRARLKASDLSAHERDFLTCMDEVCEQVCRIADRFAQQAARMAALPEYAGDEQNLRRIAQTACRIPRQPAQTFYEALCAIWFTREICNALDGFGFAVIGHIDRLLGPFYTRDVKAGRLTPEEAQEMVDCFVSMTDARWDLSQELPGGTNADLVIGGCDRDGSIVCNDVTTMVINSFRKYRFANPKLQCRISARHPAAYFKQVGELAALGLNVLSVFNDDVIIRANEAQGKKPEDCRLYLAGGCQEILVDHEVNSRAYTYLNLVQMLNGSLFPERWNEVFARDGFRFESACEAEDFETFYRIVMRNYQREIDFLAARYSKFGSNWKTINPSLLLSATHPSCIRKAKDVSEGGAEYNTDSFAVSGTGTVIDSLLAIRQAVYLDKIVTMDGLRRALQENFENDELLRQYLLHKAPKFCRDSEATAFGARVMRDFAARLSGQPNSRGGRFEASLFAFYSYSWFKDATCATADGRKRGTPLSRGVNPSESTAGVDIAALLDAQRQLDYTQFPGGAVIYMDIPLTTGGIAPEVFASVMRLFCENGGSIMDFNVVDVPTLLDAQKHPENHKNIVVRVCGYSALFHSLPRQMQDEVIARTQR